MTDRSIGIQGPALYSQDQDIAVAIERGNRCQDVVGGEVEAGDNQAKGGCMRKGWRCPTLRLGGSQHGRIDVKRQPCNLMCWVLSDQEKSKSGYSTGTGGGVCTSAPTHDEVSAGTEGLFPGNGRGSRGRGLRLPSPSREN